MNTPHAPTSDDHQPGCYEIRVKGLLDARWAARFDGLRMTSQSDGSTIISGPVADQAALHGLLRAVRDLGLPLVSVRRVDADRPDAPESNP